MRLKFAGAILFLLLALGCGGTGGGVAYHNTLVVPPDTNYSTFFRQATIVFPKGTFANTTTVTLTDAKPPHFTDPKFHAIRRTLTFSAPATASAIEVSYPDSPGVAQLVAVVLNGPEVVATLPINRQDGQVTVYVDPALSPSGAGALQVTICLGWFSD